MAPSFLCSADSRQTRGVTIITLKLHLFNLVDGCMGICPLETHLQGFFLPLPHTLSLEKDQPGWCTHSLQSYQSKCSYNHWVSYFPSSNFQHQRSHTNTSYFSTTTTNRNNTICGCTYIYDSFRLYPKYISGWFQIPLMWVTFA